MAQVRVLVAALALLTTAACAAATPPQEEEETMDLTDARSTLVDVATSIFEAVAPEVKEPFQGVEDVPCGGPVGTEWSSVRFNVRSVDGITVDDVPAALTAAEELLTTRGWNPVERLGGYGFSTDDGISGNVLVHGTTLKVLASSPCLPNTER